MPFQKAGFDGKVITSYNLTFASGLNPWFTRGAPMVVLGLVLLQFLGWLATLLLAWLVLHNNHKWIGMTLYVNEL